MFWTSGDVSSGFQSQSGQPYSHFGKVILEIYSLRFISGVTPLPVYIANVAASSLSPHVCWDARI